MIKTNLSPKLNQISGFDALDFTCCTHVLVEFDPNFLDFINVVVKDGNSVEPLMRKLLQFSVFKDFEDLSYGIRPQDWNKPDHQQVLSIWFIRKEINSIESAVKVVFSMKDRLPYCKKNQIVN